MLLMLGIMGLIFWFMVFRPESKRKKEAEAMRNAIKVGDDIITIGGICGNVISVKEDRLVIETSADQVRMEITKWAVSSNETAAAAKKAAEKKAIEDAAKAKAAKKAAKGK
ncbi:MAG: preprotein translocase subunit YajC [Oscillospiraceae bacterium]|nr:preprotein translocase subunit YajC [Oscillospiraceae bacterium]